jgi:WD40 repeat protein
LLRELLWGQTPERTGDVDLRGFEWYYWNRLSHAELLTLQDHEWAVNAVAFSPVGRLLATAGDDQLIYLWDRVNGRHLRTFQGHKVPIHSVAFSPDGNWLASAGGTPGPEQRGEIKLWDTAAGR